MGPARTTVLRNVLVSQVSKIVDSIDVIPYPCVREVNLLQRLSHLVCDGASRVSLSASTC
jgi:hypothetical protein